jgi:hypothetical protein
MKFATCALLFAAFAAAALPPTAAASLPEGKVAVVRVTAIEGLADPVGVVKESRSTAFTYDGTTYTLDHRAVADLDGVETLVLVDRRRDSRNGDTMERHHSQDIITVDGTYFEVRDIPNKVLGYQIAMIGGNLRLTGDGDQILCSAGVGGPFHIWKVEDIDLIDRKAIAFR